MGISVLHSIIANHHCKSFFRFQIDIVALFISRQALIYTLPPKLLQVSIDGCLNTMEPRLIPETSPTETLMAVENAGEMESWRNACGGSVVQLENIGEQIHMFTELAAKVGVPQRNLAICTQSRTFLVLSQMQGKYTPGNFPVNSSLWDLLCFCCDDIETVSKPFLSDGENDCPVCTPGVPLCEKCADRELQMCFLCYSCLPGWSPQTKREQLLESVWTGQQDLIEEQATYRSPTVGLADLVFEKGEMFETLVRD